MGEQKFRHELKHYINLSDYFALRHRLRVVTKPDGNSGIDGTYKVRSLYFDNIYDKVLREKIDGLNNREKFRIRIYDNDDSYIRLEKKSKKNGLCSKESILISKEECMKLTTGNYTCNLGSDAPLLIEFCAKMQFQQLKPKTLVDYRREAFIYPVGNVRITIDSHIKTGLNCTDLLNPNTPTISTSNIIILEVKFDEFLPEIISDIIQSRNREVSAFSKYAACRMV